MCGSWLVISGGMASRALAASAVRLARRSAAYSQLVELMRSSVLGAVSTAWRKASAACVNSPRK